LRGHRFQERLYLVPQIVVAVTFVFEECLTLARWSFQRRVKNPFDLARAFAVHRRVRGRVFYDVSVQQQRFIAAGVTLH